MSDETKEVKEEVKKVETKTTVASKFLDVVAKAIDILENIPKALAGLLLMVSLLGGATGVYGAMKPEEKAEQNTGELSSLERRVYTLEVEKNLLNDLLLKMLSAEGLVENDMELEAFITEVISEE